MKTTIRVDADPGALAKRLATEYAVSRLLNKGREVADTLPRVLEVVGRELGWKFALCWTLAPNSPECQPAMRVAAHWGSEPRSTAAFQGDVLSFALHRGEGFAGRVWASGHPQWIAEVGHDPDFLMREAALAARLGAGISCPIVFGGEILGILQLFAAAGVVPDPDSLPVLTSVAEQIGQYLDHNAVANSLQSSERRLRALFDANIAGVHCSDPEGRPVAINPAFVRMFGFPSLEAAMACRTGDLYVDAADRERLLEQLRLHGRDENRQLQLRRHDGSRIWVLANTVLLPEKDGLPAMNESTVIDITEAKDIARRREHTSRLESIGRLAGGVAHDFNNLLMVINGYSELVLAHLPGGDANRAALERIHQAGKRAETLTQQLLAVSRRQTAEPVSLDLEAAVQEAEGLLSASLGSRIRVRRYCEAGLAKVLADPSQISQILVNLSINARDAMPEGGDLVFELNNVTIDIDYTRRHVQARTGEFVRLQVSDTGTGIDAETKAHIFEPFFTTKPRDKGTGLGLATVYGLVLQHGGWIELYTEVGHGTTFRLYFPRAGEAPAGQKAAAPTPPEPGRGETVLIADDDGGVRDLMRDILRSSGYDVHCVTGAAEAITMASQAARLDLLITDLILPDQTGMGVAAEVTSLHPEVPVLLMSGYSRQAALHQGLLPAAPHRFHYLQKPFGTDQLLRAISDCLESRRRAQGA